MTEQEVQEQWQSIKKNFDWKKVHRVMTFLNWEWVSSNGVPSIQEMQQCVLTLCHGAAKDDATGMATGGFRVEKYRSEFGGEWLRVDFSVSWWDTE